MADEATDNQPQTETTDSVEPAATEHAEDAAGSDVVTADAPSNEVEAAPSAAPAPAEQEPLTQPGMNWYVLRVASNKEGQVQKALTRKVKIEGMEQMIGRIMVPTLKEKRMKSGQARVFERKLYPGYVFVEMATEEDGSVPENVWFLVKETTGVGDFIGSEGKPTKMDDHDVVNMLAASLQTDDTPSLSGLNFKKGDVVKVTEGSFENFEGNIESVDEHRGMVTVLLTIFGRSTPVEVEYWQLERV